MGRLMWKEVTRLLDMEVRNVLVKTDKLLR
jgi:hypothetical protein